MTSGENHIQLVWDTECASTAQTPSGRHIQVGPEGEWTPEQLLLAAAESSVMATFFDLAKEWKIEVLGYVSSAGITRPGLGKRVRVVVRPCVVIGREVDRTVVHELLAKALDTAPVARALGPTLNLAPEVILVAQEAPVA